MTELITNKQWDLAVSRAFKAEVRTAGRAYGRATISNHCHAYVVEVRDDTLIVKDGWREAIKQAAAIKA